MFNTGLDEDNYPGNLAEQMCLSQTKPERKVLVMSIFQPIAIIFCPCLSAELAAFSPCVPETFARSCIWTCFELLALVYWELKQTHNAVMLT